MFVSEVKNKMVYFSKGSLKIIERVHNVLYSNNNNNNNNICLKSNIQTSSVDCVSKCTGSCNKLCSIFKMKVCP